MKAFLLFLFFTPLFCKGQKLALLDRHFLQPITRADTITLEQVTNGLLPVYFKDVRSLIQTMQRLVKYIDGSKHINEDFSDIGIGNSNCIVKTERSGHSKKFNIVLNTKTEIFKTYIVLVDNEANKRTVQRLNIFLDYLRNNSSIIGQKF